MKIADFILHSSARTTTPSVTSSRDNPCVKLSGMDFKTNDAQLLPDAIQTLISSWPTTNQEFATSEIMEVMQHVDDVVVSATLQHTRTTLPSQHRETCRNAVVKWDVRLQVNDLKDDLRRRPCTNECVHRSRQTIDGFVHHVAVQIESAQLSRCSVHGHGFFLDAWTTRGMPRPLSARFECYSWPQSPPPWQEDVNLSFLDHRAWTLLTHTPAH